MSAFKPGDRVRIIAGPRAGEVTMVSSELFRVTLRLNEDGSTTEVDDLVHELALRSHNPSAAPWSHVVAKPAWLRRADDDEKAEWTEELRQLCGVKEPADG
jgi:hypothetical protein